MVRRGDAYGVDIRVRASISRKSLYALQSWLSYFLFHAAGGLLEVV